MASILLIRWFIINHWQNHFLNRKNKKTKKESEVKKVLPTFDGFQSYVQGGVASLIIIVMLVLVVLFLARREFGGLIAVIIIGGMLIVSVRNPEGVIVKIAQGIINKLMNMG